MYYTFTRKFNESNIVHTRELAPDVAQLPKWRAYFCAFIIAKVGLLTCHVYRLVGSETWMRERTFWGD